MANKSAAHNKPAATVVETKKGLSRQGKLALLAVVVVLLLTGGLSWWLQNRYKVVQTPEQKAYNEIQTKKQQFSNSTDYSGQIDTYKQYLDTNPSRENQRSVNAKLAAAYMNSKDYASAATAYRKVLDLSDDDTARLAAYHGIADASEQNGNKADSLAAYQAALKIGEAAPAGDFMHRDVEVDKANVARLQAAQ